MSQPSHLFLTFSRAGWGEATFGLNLAEQLRRRDENVFFLTHANNLRLFAGTPFEHHPIGDHIGSLISLLIKECAHERNVASLVLCDTLTTDGLLGRFNLDGGTLLDLDVPVIGVDTWDNATRADSLDIFGTDRAAGRKWVRNIPRLLPCPILRPDDQPGVCSFLSSPVALPKRVRNSVRGELGLRPKDSAVLFCTAPWQQTTYNDTKGDRCAITFLELLTEYIKELGPDVYFIHVGPGPLESLQRIGYRYKWLPPLGNKFDLVLGAVDLLLSANVSATTINKAIFSQIPVLILTNSCKAQTLDEATEWLGGRATHSVIEWLHSAVPIFPFSLWPIGFHRFVSPLLRQNPYNDAVEHVEWLDRRRFIESMNALLFSASARTKLQERQYEYESHLRRIPTAADTFKALLRSYQCAA